MDVCQIAVPRVGTCIVVASSWNNDTPIFRTREAPWNQRVSLCEKIVICAPTGEGDIVNLYGRRRAPPRVGATKKRRLLAVACQRRIS
jgi:hypothetical protein